MTFRLFETGWAVNAVAAVVGFIVIYWTLANPLYRVSAAVAFAIGMGFGLLRIVIKITMIIVFSAIIIYIAPRLFGWV